MKPAENYPTKTDYYSEFKEDLKVFQNTTMGNTNMKNVLGMEERLGFIGEFLN